MERISDRGRNKIISDIKLFLGSLAKANNDHLHDGNAVILEIFSQLIKLVCDNGVASDQAETNYQIYSTALEEVLETFHGRQTPKIFADLLLLTEILRKLVAYANRFMLMSNTEFVGQKGSGEALCMAKDMCNGQIYLRRDLLDIHKEVAYLVIEYFSSHSWLSSTDSKFRLGGLKKQLGAMFELQSCLSGYMDTSRTRESKTLFDCVICAVVSAKSGNAGKINVETNYQVVETVLNSVGIDIQHKHSNLNKFTEMRDVIEGIWLVAHDQVGGASVKTHMAVNVRGDGSCFYQALFYWLLWIYDVDSGLIHFTLTDLKNSIIQNLFDRQGKLKRSNDPAVEGLGIWSDREFTKELATGILQPYDREFYADEQAVQMAAAAFNVQILLYKPVIGCDDSKFAELEMAYPSMDGHFAGKPVVLMLRTGGTFKTGHFYMLGMYPAIDGIVESIGDKNYSYPELLEFEFHNQHTPSPLLNACIGV